jgi:hypothetical protein
LEDGFAFTNLNSKIAACEFQRWYEVSLNSFDGRFYNVDYDLRPSGLSVLTLCFASHAALLSVIWQIKTSLGHLTREVLIQNLFLPELARTPHWLSFGTT